MNDEYKKLLTDTRKKQIKTILGKAFPGIAFYSDLHLVQKRKENRIRNKTKITREILLDLQKYFRLSGTYPLEELKLTDPHIIDIGTHTAKIPLKKLSEIINENYRGKMNSENIVNQEGTNTSTGGGGTNTTTGGGGTNTTTGDGRNNESTN
jgi:hypothetical protein